MNEKMKKTYHSEREGWIELLRIISMFWIILFHFSDHGTIDMVEEPFSLNWLFLAFARVGGGIGNCLFVLISGYLLYEKKFKISRVITLWAEVEFYSLLSYILSIALGVLPYQGMMDLVKNIFPILSGKYWFISSYLLMYSLTPFLNHFIRTVDGKTHLMCIVVLFGVFSLPQSIPHIHWMGSEGNIEIFVLLYMVGSFVKKYDLFTQNKRILSAATLLLLVCLLLSEVVIKLIVPNRFSYFVWPMSKCTIIVLAVFIFGTLKGTRLSLPPYMFNCAQSVFGVYLIHIGRMEKWFFELTFDISNIYGKMYFPAVLICYGLMVFVLCLFVDQLRIIGVERHIYPVIKKLSDKLEKRLPESSPLQKARRENRNENSDDQ